MYKTMAIALVEHQAGGLLFELRGKTYVVACSSDTSSWRTFSPKSVSGFIRPLHHADRPVYTTLDDCSREQRLLLKELFQFPLLPIRIRNFPRRTPSFTPYNSLPTMIGVR